jgi:hypothetical protein
MTNSYIQILYDIAYNSITNDITNDLGLISVP